MLKVVTLGHPILREDALSIKEITEEIINFANEMIVTMDEMKGIGLAATKVNKGIRLFVKRAQEDSVRVFFNPEIIRTSMNSVIIEEGCLSIPGVRADVERPSQISVQAFNHKHRPIKSEADGMLARVIQHEMDHLNGVLFIDRIDNEEKQRVLSEYESLQGQERTDRGQ